MSKNATPVNVEAKAPQEAREASGLTKADLAAQVPCSLTTVYFVESSGRWPRSRSLRAAYISAISRAIAAAKAVKA